MKWAHSLRLRVTLWCALLLTLCCTALAVTSNLSAIQLEIGRASCRERV